MDEKEQREFLEATAKARQQRTLAKARQLLGRKMPVVGSGNDPAELERKRVLVRLAKLEMQHDEMRKELVRMRKWGGDPSPI